MVCRKDIVAFVHASPFDRFVLIGLLFLFVAGCIGIDDQLRRSMLGPGTTGCSTTANHHAGVAGRHRMRLAAHLLQLRLLHFVGDDLLNQLRRMDRLRESLASGRGSSPPATFAACRMWQHIQFAKVRAQTFLLAARRRRPGSPRTARRQWLGELRCPAGTITGATCRPHGHQHLSGVSLT
uniref:Uncharacterized protein n=1 Tax=Anopheles atroparvus TaxID=41427 RepID=A0A182J923_ANOAO